MCRANNEIWKTTNDGRNRTTNSRKQNCRRNGNFQIPGNIGSGHHQTLEDEKKKSKNEYLRRTRKFLEAKTIKKKSHQSDKHLGCFLRKIYDTVLKADERGYSINEAENNKTHHNTKALSSQLRRRPTACVE